MKLLVPAVTLAAASAFADFSADTIGFYPFTDGETGTSADGVTLVNAANPGTFDAAGVQYDNPNTTAKGVIRFDDDVPGTYLFDDVTAILPQPVCSDFKSIWIMTDASAGALPANATRSGGYISLPDISTELSKCGASGFTVEFFWKIPADEPCPSTWAAALTLDVGIADSNGAAKKVSVAFPLGSLTDTKYGAYLSVFTSDTPWGSYASYGSPITYDEWHHLALTFNPSQGKFRVVGDYKYEASISGLSVSEIAAAKEIKLGMRYDGAWAGFHGKIAGLRFTGRPLADSELLKASDKSRYRNVREPDSLTFDADTVAFYSFKEGAGRVGEEAKDVAILNDVSEAHVGLAAKSGACAPTYSDEAPGPYVFIGYGKSLTACCTNAMSLAFAGGTVSFEDVGTELSKHDESTIEFFWKMDPSEDAVGWNPTMAWDGGYFRNDVAFPLSIILPLGAKDSSYSKEFRVVKKGEVSSAEGFMIAATYPDLPEDGMWHHLAITYKNGELALYKDYGKVNSVAGFTRQELATSKPFELGCGKFRGKIACLRVSKKALTTKEMLYASSDSACYPSKVEVRLRMDGTAGTAVDGTHNLVNSAPTYSEVNPGIYGTFSALTKEDGVGQSAHSIFPMLNGVKWWTQVRESKFSDPLENRTSVYFCTTPKASSADIFATGPSVRVYTSLDETETVEAFVKFDYNGYWQHIGSQFSETRNRITLLSQAKSSDAKWNLQIDSANSETGAKIKLEAVCKSGTGKSASWTIGKAIRNKWHHYAVVYDKENLRMFVYCDYEKVITLDLPEELMLDVCNMYGLGGGANNQPFDGWIDEFRVSRGILSVDEFLRPDGRPGMMLMVR